MKITNLFTILLCVCAGIAVAQDDIGTAVRKADESARKAAVSARKAAESAEKAVKLAKEAADEAGIEIEELDTMEVIDNEPLPVSLVEEKIVGPSHLIDQVEVPLSADTYEEDTSTTDSGLVAEPVYQDVYDEEEQPSYSGKSVAKDIVCEPDHSLQFHGYFRAGYLADLNNNDEKLRYRDTADRKEALGRLGLEVDEWWYAKVCKNFTRQDGGWGKAVLTYGSVNSGLDADDFVLFQGASALTTGLLEAYLEFGILDDPEASVWFGQRFYGRELYSGVADFYYTDYSGTGFGLEDLPMGCGQLDIAYLTSDFSKEGWFGRFSDDGLEQIPLNGGIFETEELLHSLHVAYQAGCLDVGVTAKYYPSNRSAVNAVRGVTDSGVEAFAAHKQDSFFGIAEGCSTFVFQVGGGLSSGPGLGAGFNTHNIFRLGADPVDFINRRADDVSYRASTFGCFSFNDCIDILPHVLVQVDEGSTDRTLVSGVLRGEIGLSDCLSLVAETGIEHVDTDDGLANDGYQYKVSIAPTVTFCSGGLEKSISLVAAHIDGDAQRGYLASETVLGVQATVRW